LDWVVEGRLADGCKRKIEPRDSKLEVRLQLYLNWFN